MEEELLIKKIIMSRLLKYSVGTDISKDKFGLLEGLEKIGL